MSKLPINLYSSVNQRVIDGVIAGISFWLAYQAIFEGCIPASIRIQMSLLLPAMTIGRICWNQALGCYRMSWKYIGLRDGVVLGRNYGAFSLMLAVLHYVIPHTIFRIPLGVIASELLLSFTGASAVRVTRRISYERATGAASMPGEVLSVLLIGAGRAGVNVANQLRTNTSFRPVAFLDDDLKKIGLVIAGLKVLGPLTSLDAVAQELAIRQVIICMARPSREMLRRIWATCDLLGVSVKIVPTLEEILNRKINIVNFRNVEMNDLLGRTPVEQSPNEPDIAAAYSGKRILVTGAGGSIGSELALQLSKFNPSRLLLLDKDENGLNDTYLHLDESVRSTASALVADLRFPERLRGILATFRPEVVFHAAAHKHVHLMETNPCEAITNNVTGTRNLIEQSLAFGVTRFVHVSTDKAVNPTSIMGASKRVCEMVVQAQGSRKGTLFCCVRFGNVLGSRGSVVPIFQEQIQRGGPVTLTHPEAQRFLMTIPEAVCLLIQAGTLANNRDIFVLDMGQPVLIHKLAQDLIELSGLAPNRDVRIEITGLKPGEKVSEVLMDNSSELRRTRLEKVQAISTRDFDVATFTHRLRALERSAWEDDLDQVYQHLAGLNIGYARPVPPRPWPSAARVPVSVPAVGGSLATELS